MPLPRAWLEADFSRRRLLHGALAGGALLAWPRPGWPQPPASSPGRPKVALVIGNSQYRQVPLRNPVNDARAIAAALGGAGFAVTQKLDVPHAELVAAVQTYVTTVARDKGAGVFYYAGHGAQLAWRNYMVPVDASIAAVEDIRTQGVEVNSLLEGLARAVGGVNVIILDACRDNPFGTLAGLEQKGLSQMDAPRNTLLAYATSPGNVASDGAGDNGLYTENLLREMSVREAKIEDVFKRVRLSVRLQSKGAQVPWESTSLEEDFYFIPPRRFVELSEAEKDRQFDEELAVWQKANGATDPTLLEDYLRRHPSGRFAELAQLQLDRALARRGERKVRIASASGNPFTRGSAGANTGWKVGDRYAYRMLDRLANDERPQMFTVSEVTDTEVRFSNGEVVDLLGNVLRRPGGRTYSPNQMEPVEYAVGKQWRTEFRTTTPKGVEGKTVMELKIAAREPVTVGAGTFDAFRVEGHGTFADPRHRQAEQMTLRKWVAPDRLRFPVAWEEERKRGDRKGATQYSRRWELTSFRER